VVESAGDRAPVEEIEAGAGGRVETAVEHDIERAAGREAAGDSERVVLRAAKQAAEFHDERAGGALRKGGVRDEGGTVARRIGAVVLKRAGKRARAGKGGAARDGHRAGAEGGAAAVVDPHRAGGDEGAAGKGAGAVEFERAGAVLDQDAWRALADRADERGGRAARDDERFEAVERASAGERERIVPERVVSAVREKPFASVRAPPLACSVPPASVSAPVPSAYYCQPRACRR